MCTWTEWGGISLSVLGNLVPAMLFHGIPAAFECVRRVRVVEQNSLQGLGSQLGLAEGVGGYQPPWWVSSVKRSDPGEFGESGWSFPLLSAPRTQPWAGRHTCPHGACRLERIGCERVAMILVVWSPRKKRRGQGHCQVKAFLSKGQLGWDSQVEGTRKYLTQYLAAHQPFYLLC